MNDMKYLIAILALVTLAAAGCKHQYWTILGDTGAEPVIVADTPEPEQPKPEAQAPKEVIFILGIDGMD
jgi:hypothetical protein